MSKAVNKNKPNRLQHHLQVPQRLVLWLVNAKQQNSVSSRAAPGSTVKLPPSVEKISISAFKPPSPNFFQNHKVTCHIENFVFCFNTFLSLNR